MKHTDPKDKEPDALKMNLDNAQQSAFHKLWLIGKVDEEDWSVAR